MRLRLHGGFGEKGRTCLQVESSGYHLLLDAGVKTSSIGGPDYYPSIDAGELAAIDAIIVTHAHEDHIAALGWCIAAGFSGRIFMTRETQREADAGLAGYATEEHRALARQARVETLLVGPRALQLGPLSVSTGRSGHMAGCVWCGIDDGKVRLCYCGDMVPGSAVFAADAVPICDAIVIDASYGDDNVAARERARQIGAWIESHVHGCVLPTPLYGRSAELLAIVHGPLALAPGMRGALREQLGGASWLTPHAFDALSARLARAADWQPGDPFPKAALLCHDAMGISGTSPAILADAQRLGHAALFTGHLPASSPGERMVAQGQAAWIRLPTHPTLAENRALVASSRAAKAIGHSCELAALERMKPHIPQLDATLATGDGVDL